MVNLRKKMIKYIIGSSKQMRKFLYRLIKKPNWHNLRRVEPISRVFGFDRGTPIDRVYIEHFLNLNKQFIQGTICEIGDDIYSKKFGSNIRKIEVLNYTPDNPKATIIGDLSKIDSLPSNTIDCFICTQTLNFIYDVKSAVSGIFHMLKEGGVVLATVSGISQISRYDMDRWGDYWRFTDLSAKKVFEEVFGVGNVEVDTYGNVLAAIAFLHGISAEELTEEELFFKDKDYQLTITIKAVKK